MVAAAAFSWEQVRGEFPVLTESSPHQPVLLREVCAALLPALERASRGDREPRVLDLTLGAGGHSAGILERAPGSTQLLGLDRDPAARALAADRLAAFGSRVRIRAAAFSQVETRLAEEGWSEVDAVVADLGVSSMQLDVPERGFSFRQAAPLDMRMDPTTGESAADLLARLDLDELTHLLRDLGEEPQARRIARALVADREAGRAPKTTLELRNLVGRVVRAGGGGRRGAAEGSHRDPATRTFQALRIAVNGELSELDFILDILPRILAPGARVAILSYHSLEDRRVKKAFRNWFRSCVCPPELPVCACPGVARARALGRGAVVADEVEVRENPRARSARLRAMEWSGARS